MGGRGSSSATASMAAGSGPSIDAEVAEALGAIGYSASNLPSRPTGVSQRANEVYYALSEGSDPGGFSAKTGQKVRELAEYNLGYVANYALKSITTDSQLAAFANSSARAAAEAANANAWNAWNEAKDIYERVVSALG